MPTSKKLKKYLDFKIPTSLLELQCLHGMLNYFKLYIPHYNSIMQPIISLLGAEEPTWTSLHTEIVKSCVDALLLELKLAAPDFEQKFSL